MESKLSGCLLIFLMFIYFWEREREAVCEQGGSRERGRHRIWSRFQALSCQHRAWCGARTHKLWDHDLRQSQMLNRLSHPGAPTNWNLNKNLKRTEHRFQSRWEIWRVADFGVPGWLSWLSVWLRLRSWSHSLWVRAPHQALCWRLRAWSLLWILPLSLCPSPTHALSLSVSKINKH